MTRTATTIAEGAPLLEAGASDLLVADVADSRAEMALLGATGPGRPAMIALLRERGSTFEAFNNGADQVVMVPFTPDELAVRTFALLRRLGRPTKLVHDQPFGGLTLSLDERIEIGGRSVALTPVLNSLLYLLAANSNKPVAADDIRDLAWGFGPQTSVATIRRHVRELRAALGESASIQARQQAYVFVPS